MTGRGGIVKRAGEAAAASTPARTPAKSQPRVMSEGRYRITVRPDGALVIAWFAGTGGKDEGGGVITLPPLITKLVGQAAAGEEVSPAELLRALTMALRPRRGRTGG